MNITMERDSETGVLTFTCGEHTKVVDPAEYASGSKIKKDVLTWARPLGGTETVGF